jgi:TetR/AcrR family fatty acid metabolism transcriptional regulator
MKISPRQFEIIESAGKLLSIGGISNLTTKKLAQEMKFSEAALYRHFKNKNEIIIAMLNYLAEEMDSRIEETLKPVGNSISKLEILFTDQFKFFNKNRHFLVAIFPDGLWENNSDIHNAVKGLMAVKKKHLNLIFKEGINKNQFNGLANQESLTHICMGTFRLHMLKWKMENYKFDLEKTGTIIIKDLLLLVKK